MKRLLGLLLLILSLGTLRAQTVAFIGDVHVADSTQLTYFQRTVVDALLADSDIDACVWLGDIVNESPEWIPAVAGFIKQFNSFCVMGNHDFDLHNKSANEFWAGSFGNDNYCFKVGRRDFVALNNGRGSYSEEAFKLVENIPSSRPLIICQHIPILSTKGGEEMMALLEKRKGRTLIMSAHEHIVRKTKISDKVSEVIAGSVCTNWWRGVPAWGGIPYAPMQCGSPRNIFLLHLGKAADRLEFRTISGGEDQMRLWISGENPADREVDLLAMLPEGLAVLNVFAAADDACVTVSIDDGKPCIMEKSSMIDPSVARLRHACARENYARKDPRRTVHLRYGSPHLWQFSLEGLPSGVHVLSFHATDSFGLNVEQKFVYCR